MPRKPSQAAKAAAVDASQKLVVLRAPAGADQANFGDKAYPVNDGKVVVPLEAVESLTTIGGFELDEEPEVEPETVPAPDDRVALKHESSTGASWGGQSFEPDEDGVFYVPPAAVSDLMDHGFEHA